MSDREEVATEEVGAAAAAATSPAADLGSDEEEGAAGAAAKSEPSSAAAAADDDDKKDDDDKAEAQFECNICLDVARDAVISLCGHLFCWPCLHQWLETRPNRKICPVCKAGISKEKVIPLYGRGNTDQKDPREKAIPPRPRGQRSEPENTGGANNFFNFGGGGNNGIQMSFGIGAFPFGFFATNMNLGNGANGGAIPRPGNNPGPGTAQFEEEQFLQKVFLWVAFAFIFWLLIA